MGSLKYKLIKSREQYNAYAKILEELVFSENANTETEEEIELLTLLIEKYDQENNTLKDVDPVKVIRSLMKEHNLKAKDLTGILSVSKSLVSDILNYKKGLSKEVIRKLADHFSIDQAAFNRPYKLKGTKRKLKKARVET